MQFLSFNLALICAHSMLCVSEGGWLELKVVLVVFVCAAKVWSSSEVDSCQAYSTILKTGFDQAFKRCSRISRWYGLSGSVTR